MIDTGVITGEEKFGVYEYPPNEDGCVFSPNKFETFVDEFTEETVGGGGELYFYCSL